MGSLAISSTINCCSSRHPPSPDALSPRPALSPVSVLQKTSARTPKNRRPSISSVDTLELGPALPPSDKAPSTSDLNENVRGSSKIRAIFHDMSFESSPALDAVKQRKSISSINLSTVKQRLKKHLSRDSALTKRHSRSSVGTSEEEIERRAELRRIRQRRIQEELSNEGIYDEDAKSLPSIIDVPEKDTERAHSRSSWIPGTPLSLPALKAPALSFPALSLPKLRPIDIHHETPRQHLKAFGSNPNLDMKLGSLHSNQTLANSIGTISRRHSSPMLVHFERCHVDPCVYIPSRKGSSIPSLPPTPNIVAQRLPSIAEPHRSSWRLSFTSPNRGEHLRKLSRDYSASLILTSEILGDGHQPLNKWLYSQGMRSPSEAVEGTATGSIAEDMVSDLHICCKDDELRSVDGPEERFPVGLHEMDISQRLARRSLQVSISSPQLSRSGSHQRITSSMSGDSRIKRPNRSHRWDTSDSIPLSQRIPQSWGRIIQDGTSSIYPSEGNSIQPSPQTSRFDLVSLIASSRSMLNVVQHTDRESDLQNNNILTIQNTNDTADNLVAPATPYARRSTLDNGSILASETDSFREREAELKVVQARFATDKSSPFLGTPRSSKFREEFDMEPRDNEGAKVRVRKQSAFLRLTRFATRSYDGAAGMEDLLAVPMPHFEPMPSPLRSPGPLSPLSDSQDASAIWGKAVKLTADDRASQVGSQLHIPKQKHRLSSTVSKRKSSVGRGLRKISWSKTDKGKDAAQRHESAAAEYEQRFQERLAVKELVLDDWEAEMAATAQKAKARSKNIVKKTKAPTGPDKRFPLSWSRFPSHSRSERSLTAGKTDRVESHDFAMRTNEAGEHIFHQCREIGDLHLHDDDPEWHKYSVGEMGLRARVGDKISQKVYKMETHGGGSRAFEFQTDGRRGSMMVASKKEFPELEILPLNEVVTTEEELEQMVSEQKMMDVREERKKIAAKMAMYGDGSTDFESELDQEEETTVDNSELSIADPRFYEDCVIVPMNDDDDEDDCDDTIEIQISKVNFTDKAKFKTWHGRDVFKYTYQQRKTSLGTAALRKSTDEYHYELEAMVKEERERVLKSAEDAWADRKESQYISSSRLVTEVL